VGEISAWAVREKINRASWAGGWDPRAAAARTVLGHARLRGAGGRGHGPREASARDAKARPGRASARRGCGPGTQEKAG
jgi:hypothetical protein